MLLFLNLVDKTQMSLPPEHATRDIKLKISNCLSVRANLLYTFQCETPCRWVKFLFSPFNPGNLVRTSPHVLIRSGGPAVLVLLKVR